MTKFNPQKFSSFLRRNFKNYLGFLRIKDWRAYFLIGLFGFLISKGFLFPLGDIFLFFLIGFLLLGFGFSVNDCFDVKEDKYHLEKENLLVNKKLSFKKALILSITTGVLGLGLSMFFGLKIFLFCLGAFLLGLFYSAPPLRFKSRPFLDLISHGLFAGALIFFFPVLVFNKNLNFLYYLIGLTIFYLSVTAELRNHLEDYQIDKRAGLKTTVCVLGYQNSERLLRYLAILSPLILLPIFLLISKGYLFLFLIFTPIFLLFFLSSENYQTVKNYKIMDAYVFFSFGLLTVAIL